MEGNFQFQKTVGFEDQSVIDTGSNVPIVVESCKSTTIPTEVFATGVGSTLTIWSQSLKHNTPSPSSPLSDSLSSKEDESPSWSVKTVHETKLSSKIGKMAFGYDCVLEGDDLSLKLCVGAADKRLRYVHYTRSLDGTVKPNKIILTGHEEEISGCQFMGTQTLVSCSNDNTCRLWDIERKEEKQRFSNAIHQLGAPCSLATHPRSMTEFLVGFQDGTVRLYDSRMSLFAYNFSTGLNVPLSQVDWSSVLYNRIGCASGGKYFVWDLAANKKVASSQAHSSQCTHFRFSQTNPNLFATSDGRQMGIWDVSHLSVSSGNLRKVGAGNIHSACWLSRSSTFVAASHCLTFWRYGTVI